MLVQDARTSLVLMQPYVDAARRSWWAILVVLGLTWGTGALMAYEEFTTSFEADATIWTDRTAEQFAPTNPQDTSISNFVTPAAEQAGILSQLLQTRSFLSRVVDRAAIARPQGMDERSFLQDISRRFHVDVLGTNLFRVLYRARDPKTGGQMVLAALAERQERLTDSRTAATAAAETYYTTQLGVARNRVVEAQRDLASFDATHKSPLSPADDYQQRQLRVAVETATARVADLTNRIDGSALLPAVLQVADTLDFQVIDEPLAEVPPSGGTRPAATIAGGAGAAGIGLAGLLILGRVLLAMRYAARAATSGEQIEPEEERENDNQHVGFTTGQPFASITSVDRPRAATPSNTAT
jgi:uncharacterized protein involved in exopolysaccharide biosynthesis